jgi:hypothetical protein
MKITLIYKCPPPKEGNIINVVLRKTLGSMKHLLKKINIEPEKKNKAKKRMISFNVFVRIQTEINFEDFMQINISVENILMNFWCFPYIQTCIYTVIQK